MQLSEIRGKPSATREEPQEPGRPSYHPPLLRSHGALQDVSSAKPSGEIIVKIVDEGPSDVNSKENIVPITWN
jgi:hypothetical protein